MSKTFRDKHIHLYEDDEGEEELGSSFSSLHKMRKLNRLLRKKHKAKKERVYGEEAEFNSES